MSVSSIPSLGSILRAHSVIAAIVAASKNELNILANTFFVIVG